MLKSQSPCTNSEQFSGLGLPTLKPHDTQTFKGHGNDRRICLSFCPTKLSPLQTNPIPPTLRPMPHPSVNLEGHLNLRLSTGCWGNATQLKLAQQVIVLHRVSKILSNRNCARLWCWFLVPGCSWDDEVNLLPVNVVRIMEVLRLRRGLRSRMVSQDGPSRNVRRRKDMCACSEGEP